MKSRPRVSHFGEEETDKPHKRRHTVEDKIRRDLTTTLTSTASPTLNWMGSSVQDLGRGCPLTPQKDFRDMSAALWAALLDPLGRSWNRDNYTVSTTPEPLWGGLF